MEITDDQIERLRALAVDAPVVMVNLLKYRALAADGDGTGRDAYERYSRGVIKLLKARGGTILWAGDVQTVALGSDGDGDWDFIVLVQYPNCATFIDMMTSPDYAAVNNHRLNGLERHVIIAADETFCRLRT